MTLIISPSILASDLTKLGEQVAACEAAGADAIHIDVMDGSFVPNLSFGPDIVKACKRATSLPLDVHLMIVEPERHFAKFVDAGANIITIHYETCPHIHRSLQQIRELGATPGITFNPGTPLDPLRLLAGSYDLVLIMSVNPGLGGQRFIPSMTAKIEETARILRETGSEAIIQVDGGVDAKIAAEIYQAGARNFVAGSSVFGHPEGVAAGISALRAAVK